jgi:hypothetical protein
MTGRPMKALASIAACRGLCVLGAAALLTGATGCATPAPDSGRADSDRRKQSELSAMEALGQRNDDRPLPR